MGGALHTGHPCPPAQFDDYANRPIVSFPVARVLEYVKERYQRLASVAPFDLPRVRTDEDSGDRQDILERLFFELVLLHGEHLRAADDDALSRILEDSVDRARSIARRRQATGERNGGLDRASRAGRSR